MSKDESEIYWIEFYDRDASKIHNGMPFIFLLSQRWIQISPKNRHYVSFSKPNSGLIQISFDLFQHLNLKYGARRKIQNQKAVKLSENDFCKYLSVF